MGVNGFFQYIRTKYPYLLEDIHISHFEFDKIAFDISSHIYQFMSVYGKEKDQHQASDDYVFDLKKKNRWINAFIKIIFAVKKYHIHLIPVFDGKAPPEKDTERLQRRETRLKNEHKNADLKSAIQKYIDTGDTEEVLIESMKNINTKKRMMERLNTTKRLLRPITTTNNDVIQSDKDIVIDIDALNDYLKSKENHVFDITANDIADLKLMFDHFGVTYMQAPEESEALCCYLVKNKKVKAVFSCDSDCQCYGPAIQIRDFDAATGMCTVVKHDKLLKAFGFDNTLQMTDFGILCGCDYNRYNKIKGLGPVGAHKLINDWGDIDNIMSNLDTINKGKKNKLEGFEGLIHVKCRELFKPVYKDIVAPEPWKFVIDQNKLFEYLEKNGMFCNKKTVEELWTPIELVFED